ncbi:hypothetical protein [Citromicrobium sp. WPS32]|uniref:hypothetical protein n=1 Tax=Citromicrobium sp. WPS32 TaxID=1634517 RepID=UPI0012E1C1DA|nr:hypothetical protein [Citromicrobium sp. WPS32]
MSKLRIKTADGPKEEILADWDAWMKAASQLYRRFGRRLDGDSPFEYHEVAAVGFLANAAALAGFIPMNEYDVFKRGRDDKRTKVRGRADLWFDAGGRCYSFECKRTRRPVTPHYLGQRLGYAMGDVDCVRDDEYHHAAGCLLTVARDSKRIAACDQFAASDDVDIAYRIGPKAKPAYLFFRLKEK